MMRKMKTSVALPATLLSFSALWVSSATAQESDAEAGVEKGPRIQLAEDPAEQSVEPEASTQQGAAKAAAEADERTAPPASAGQAPAPGAETVPEAETQPTGVPADSSAPVDGPEQADTLGETGPGAGESAGVEDESQPRVIDVSATEVAEEDLPPPEEAKVPGSQLPFTYHLNHIDVSAGFRVVGTPDDGLQPFLVDPVLADVFVRGGMAFAVTDRIAFAPHLELGAAGTSATVREMSSELDKVHLSLGLEGRYHFIHRMFGYARVAPGLEFVSARIGSATESGVLVNDDKWPGSVAFQLDAAVGASLRLFGPDDGRERNPRLWAFAEGGYRVSGAHTLSMVIEGDGPRRAVPIELSPLDFSGGFFSTGLMASF